MPRPETHLDGRYRPHQDLAALAALPSLWNGGGPQQMADSLAAVLVRGLALDHVYVCFQGPAVEAVHDADGPCPLDRLRAVRDSLSPETAADSACTAVVPIGEHGFLVAVRRAPDFPSEIDRLLLALAAGQTATALEQSGEVESLRAREAELADWFENAPVAMHWLGPDGIILRANRAELDLLGYARDEYVGRPVTDFHADPRAGAEMLRRLRNSREVLNQEARLRCKDGSVKHVLIDANVKREHGRVLSSQCVTREAPGSASEALRQSEERFARFMQHLPGLAWVKDPQGRYVYANDAALRAFGCSRDDLPGKTDKEIFPPETAAQFRENDALALRSGAGVRVIETLEHDDGVVHHSIVSKFPIPGRDGTPALVGGVAFDITDLKQAEDALREAERRFRAVFNQQFQFMAILGPDGTVLEANETCFTATGVAREAVLGREFWDTPWWDRMPDMQERWRRAIAEAARTGGPVASEMDYRVADGAVRHATAVVTGLKDRTGRVTTVIVEGRDDTDRRRAEAALRQSEQRWRTMAEALPNLLWTDLPDGQCDWLSSQWGKYTGIPESELLGLRWLERVIHPDDRERTLACWEAACADRGDYDLEYRIRRHDGEYRWFKTRGVPVRDEHGKIIYWFGTCTDIEDHKRAEAALRQSEQRFRQLADAMPQIVWTAGPNGVIDYSNQRWYEFSGSSEGVGNEGWAAIVHPDDLPPASVRWAESVRSGEPFEREIRLLDRRAGGYRWHLIRTVPVRDEGGAVIRWYGSSTDIDGQKRAEEAARFLADASATLAAVEDYQSTLQKVAGLAVPYFADWSGVDVAAEEGVLRHLAVVHQDPERVRLAQEFIRRYPPDPRAPGGIGHVFRTGQPEIVEELTDEMLVRGAKDEEHLRLMRALGLRSYICVPLLVSGRVLGVLTFATADSGRRYTRADLSVAEDLAHRAAIAIENARLYRELREADRRKDEFLATLAHELRNPLAPVRNSLQILKLPRLDTETAERAREMMERQVHHLVRLVDDLLDVSRVMRGKVELRKERVELATVVARAVEAAQPLIDAQGHELTVDLPAEPLPLQADPVRLAQVVGNLLTNSAKYTEPGGQIRLSAERQGTAAVLCVRDTGIGIAPEMLHKVFELFVQAEHATSRAQGGLGIGLTLVRNLVEMHHGTVEARSDGLGRGSEFVVRLPLAEVPPPPARQESPAGQLAPVTGRRLLVVDDNKDAANSLAMLLRLQGHEVRVAHDGPAALELVEEYIPEVVFLDIGMPGMDGYEVARRLRSHPTLGRVLLAALTGWGQQEDRRRSSEAGFDHHLVKPVEPADLEGLLAGLSRSPG